ncbi:MAG: hypothetical protein A3J93_01110 [Candidatus Magasanikbacteria bacterium RIFOXYC2_FULL_42_28]|uniref:dTDP-4-dehydrorhamnose reductase n=1 Tax=Candidatus Magasanikbacteria bacterium RIFOXYC2_FULL_42_28 TaxID=1798704 RepID=A0A1F6NXS4_9BACT|nr:MAG: hypothetical protein A3J93_01110 [Candidatus Magasanikbacteria bacterium RIFOXYC2_FULL_42_28]
MGPKILITGNLGYIGLGLAEEAKKQNLDFFGIDKEPQTGPGVVSFNLGNAQKIQAAIKDFKPDILIHAGAHSALIYKDNLYDPFLEDFFSLSNILKALIDFPDCRLIYYSSSYVYSGLSTDTITSEDSPLKPHHNFGVAKSFFEQFILRNHKNSLIFRLCSVFGSGEAKHPNTILQFVKECLEKGQINIWGEGLRQLQYVYHKDVINYTFQSFNLQPGIYNLGGDEYVSVAEAGQLIADFCKVKVEFLKDKTEGETLPFLENKKIKIAAGKNLFTPFKIALAEYLKAIK